jgi:hypothetical protein
VTPHTPDFLSFGAMNGVFAVEYVGGLTPCWSEIKATFPEAMVHVEWFMRRMIYNNMDERLSLWLVGPRGAGKGTVLDLIKELFRDEYCTQPIENLGDPFGLSPLVGKKVNVHADGDPKTPRSLSNFRMITGGDKTLTVNVKGVRQFDHIFDPFHFISAYNQLFRLPEMDIEAFVDRVLFGVFDKKIRQDPSFKKRLLLEKDIIFSNLVQEGYAPFVYAEPTHETFIAENINIWDTWANPVRRIVEDLYECAIDANGNRMVGEEMDCEDVYEDVYAKLVDQGVRAYPEINHRLKAEVTKAFKKLFIYKSKSGGDYTYNPVRYKDKDAQKEKEATYTKSEKVTSFNGSEIPKPKTEFEKNLERIRAEGELDGTEEIEDVEEEP